MEELSGLLVGGLIAGVIAGFITACVAKRTGWAYMIAIVLFVPLSSWLLGIVWMRKFMGVDDLKSSSTLEWVINSAGSAILGVAPALFVGIIAYPIAHLSAKALGINKTEAEREWREIASEVQREDAAQAHQAKFEELVRMTEKNKADMKEWRRQQRIGGK